MELAADLANGAGTHTADSSVLLVDMGSAAERTLGGPEDGSENKRKIYN